MELVFPLVLAAVPVELSRLVSAQVLNFLIFSFCAVGELKKNKIQRVINSSIISFLNSRFL